MSWRKISCEEFEEHKSIMGDHAHVVSSFTDLSGQFGEPRIETVWGRKDSGDESIIKGIRHPGRDADVFGLVIVPDAAPCEHYLYENDGW